MTDENGFTFLLLLLMEPTLIDNNGKLRKDDVSTEPREMSININKNSISICSRIRSLLLSFAGIHLGRRHSAERKIVNFMRLTIRLRVAPVRKAIRENPIRTSHLKALACFSLTFKLLLSPHPSIRAQNEWEEGKDEVVALQTKHQ